MRREKISDDEVIEVLTSYGIPLERWRVFANHFVGYRDETGQQMHLIIEDDSFALAAVKMLQKRGQIQ